MILRVSLICLGSLVCLIGALDPNYPIFNPDDGLPSSSAEKLTKLLSLSEQQLKRIESVDYK